VNIYALIPFISVLAYVALIVIVALRPLARVHKVFIGLLAVSATWSFSSFILHADFFPTQTLMWNRGLLVLAISVPLVFYHFIRVYFNRPVGIGAYLGYVTLVGFAIFISQGGILKSSYVVDGILYWEYDASFYLLFVFLGGFMATAMLYLAQGLRRAIDPQERNKLVYLLTAISVWILFALTNLVPALANYSVDHIGNILFTLIIGYTILRYQLLNIRFVARRGLAYILLGCALIGTYIGVILLGLSIFPAQPAGSIILLAAVMALLLAVAATPLRYFIQEGVDRLFFRGTYEHRQALLSFSSKMGGILNLDELAKEILPAMTKALSITRASLLLQDIGSGDFIVHFMYPKGKSEPGDGLRFSADTPIVAWLEKETRPLNLKQIDSIPEFKGLWQIEREKLATSDLEFLCPIKSRGKLIGILAMGRKQANGLYSQEDMELVMGLAGQASIIIENAQLYAQATLRANTDGLTELYNHRQFHERLEQEIARGSRFGTVFSVIMLDIDLFKVYNDIYGHLAGDQILRKMGELIRSSVRNRVAERIRKAIESKASTKAMPVTVSLGVANWPSDGITREEIIGCADTALYRAKQTGRNRTCLSSDIVKPGTPQIGEELEARRGALNIIYALAATVDAKDHYTYGHSRKVSEYAVALAEALVLPGDRITTLRAAALLHDIGKIGVPDSILNKEGTLTEEEWEQIKAHPQDGVEILRHVINLVNCLPAILHHHEHYDGNGYPSGLKGEDIPAEARILAVADAYDAITSLRPYRQRLSPQQALDELKRCAGTQFDPGLVEVFCSMMQPTLVKELEMR
jgi:HD-GYP domain-containing protein (c-di-GMP phosphodiesterase class II)